MASRPIRTMTILTAAAALYATAHTITAHAASTAAPHPHCPRRHRLTPPPPPPPPPTPAPATTIPAPAAPASATASFGHGARGTGRQTPWIVTAWARAWNGTDPRALGALFTADGTYTDEAVAVTFRGRGQIAGWKARADTLIDHVRVTVRTTRTEGDRVTVQSLYSGHLKGAPKPFAVPMTTVLGLDAGHCRIVFDRDHYSLAAVLSQSGLPADWTPPAA